MKPAVRWEFCKGGPHAADKQHILNGDAKQEVADFRRILHVFLKLNEYSYVVFTTHSDMLGADNAHMSGLAQSFWPWFRGCIKGCRAEKNQQELFFLR